MSLSFVGYEQCAENAALDNFIKAACCKQPPATCPKANYHYCLQFDAFFLENGTYASITELAKAESVNESYACRVLRLTLLAPAIVEEILHGRQNSDLILKTLMEGFSVQWRDQLASLRFSNHK